MTYFATVLGRSAGRWNGGEVSLERCESLADLGDVLRDGAGDVRLLLIEQDDEYAAIVRLDDDADDPRAFLSDGHAADAFPVAAVVAKDLEEIGGDELAELDDDELARDAASVHDSAPFGDAEIVDDLGTPADQLVAMSTHEGTLPVDLLLAVCEKAGCSDTFEQLRE